MRASNVVVVSPSVVALVAGASCALAAPPFVPGNVVVSQVGTGQSQLVSSAATAAFLKEFTPGGGLVQTIAIPTVTSGANRRCTFPGGGTPTGLLKRSVDKRWIMFTGYDAPVGLAPVLATLASGTPRVVGRVSAAGELDTTTGLTDAFDGGRVTCAVSMDGAGYWLSGDGSGGVGAVRYAIHGASTSTAIETFLPSTFVLGLFDGGLYVSAYAFPTFIGVGRFPGGLPMSATQAVLLPGFPIDTNTLPLEFHFADAQTLYLADGSTVAAGGGLQKWTLAAGTWSKAYTIATGLNTTGLTSITAKAVGGTTMVYGITRGATSTSQTSLVVVTDTGPGSVFTTLATSPTFTAFRGVALAPEVGVPCYANCDASSVPPVLNVVDFICFQTRFAAQDPYANCDASTTPPVLNVADFVCFLNSFAGGCP
ncbi:MAG: hypothetical protein ACKVW3_05385 [Phycisphaerales bacterium]